MAYLIMQVEFEVEGMDGMCLAELEGPMGTVWDSSGFRVAFGQIEGFDTPIIAGLLRVGAIREVK